MFWQRSATPGPGPSTLRKRRKGIEDSQHPVAQELDIEVKEVRGRQRTRRQVTGAVTTTTDAASSLPISEASPSISSTNSDSGVTLISSSAPSSSFSSQSSLISATNLFPVPSLTTPTSQSISHFYSYSYEISPVTSPTHVVATRSGTRTSQPVATGTIKSYVPVAGRPLEQGENGLMVNMTLGGDDVGEA